MDKVKNIMDTNVETLDIKEGFKGAIRKLLKTKSDYLVITKNGRPYGLITERDLLYKLLPTFKGKHHFKLQDVMTKDLITTTPNTGIIKAESKMHKEVIRHLPVIKDEKLLGIISEKDIARKLADDQEYLRRVGKHHMIQTSIIILFFIFLVAYILFRLFA